jgi:hypothetical protein
LKKRIFPRQDSLKLITIHVVGITLSLDVNFTYSRKLLFMKQLQCNNETVPIPRPEALHLLIAS